MEEIGTQYHKDKQIDPSGFLQKARLHKSKFRAEVLELAFDTYGNYLTQPDGEAGKNFYNDFGIFEAVKSYRKYNKALYSNLLRSEHIPFNMFVPFLSDLEFCAKVFNEFMGGVIASVNVIKIEYAPPLKANYLNDATSFDAYIEYTHVDNSTGMIGVEVKYTEQGYKLIAGSKQDRDINEPTSKYYSVTQACNIYKPDSIILLKTDKFRQIWRNHILGESILLKDSSKKHFTSLTIFPAGNSYFVHTSKEYQDLLIENDKKFLPITYEAFLSACNKHCPNDKFQNWINYFQERYIVEAE